MSEMTIEQVMCQVLGPQQAFNTKGYICPGFDPSKDSAQGAAFTQQTEANLKLQEAASGNANIIIIGVLAIVAILLVLYFLK